MRKSSRYAAYLPFVLVAVIGLVYHVGMKPMAGDDIFFRDATKDTTLWAYLTQRYLTWTSRVVSGVYWSMSYSARFCGESLIFCCLRRCLFCCPVFSAAGR